ncbi:hypothetical protein LguiA_026819 [Lonicera macranthoides]
MATSVEEPKKLKLYSYWRSSCSCRVRIGLNLKGLDYEYKAVNLLKGEQFSPEFLKLNPIGYVPVLEDDGIKIADSFAILLYLEEKYPQHPLLPCDLQKRAINYQAANIVSSSIQPLQNLAILKYIGEKVSPDEKLPWVQHHIGNGFAALEKLLKDYAGKYATGDEVFLADLFIAPQIHGAIKRFSLDMTKYPLLSRLNEAYEELPAFKDAMPENQPDTPAEERGIKGLVHVVVIQKQNRRTRLVGLHNLVFYYFCINRNTESSGGGNKEDPIPNQNSKKLKLYSYWRSSCSWRVAIALNFKGLEYENISVDLPKGEQFTPEFLKLNPLGCVPVLVDEDIVVSESLAILMASLSISPLNFYLEEKYHQHPLLPNDIERRTVNYQKYIEEKISPDEKLPWAQHQIGKGFTGIDLRSVLLQDTKLSSILDISDCVSIAAALEKLLRNYAGKYATGEEIFLADVFLAPQIRNAIKRFSVDMTEFPLLSRLNEAYKELPAFQEAMLD